MMDHLFDLMTREETLLPDLLPHVTDGPMGKMIHHPLVIEIVYDPLHCGRTNAYYAQKKDKLEEAIVANEWHSVVFMHERPYRLQALMEFYNEGLSDDPKSFWPLVNQVWTDSENIYQHIEDWLEIWDSGAPDRHLVMDDDDRATLAGMASQFTVWRGIDREGTRDGMSWTIDEEKARWFADRYNKGRGEVFSATVNKSDVLAYLTNRNESEIVVLPEALRDVKEVW